MATAIANKLDQMVDKARDLEKEIRDLKVEIYRLRNEIDRSVSRSYKAWTSHEEEVLKNDCEKGIPITDIATRLGRWEDATRQRLGIIGVPGPWKLP